MNEEVYFTIDENSDGVLQLAINYKSSGYRICGPKYDGRSRTIKKHALTLNDVEEIKRYLRYVSKKHEI